MTDAVVQYISDIHAQKLREGQPPVSFEFFPPKTEEGERSFFGRVVPELLALNPSYCSVTYGAGGGTREKTIETVDRIQREFNLTTVMHLTCVQSTREQLRAVLGEASARGIRNILALRGDPPEGTSEFVQAEGGFEYSRELVSFIREMGGFDVATAGFPEGHIACKAGKHADWGYLAEKVRAGASAVITQLFFRNADYFEFRSYMSAKLGINVPIIPGLLPILSRGQTKKFVALCGAALPGPFLARLEELGDDDEAVAQFGIDYCTAQAAELLQQGAPGLHFYTLNKARSTVEVIRRLGLG